LSTIAHTAPRRIPNHSHDWPFVSLLVAGAYRSSTRSSHLELNAPGALCFPPGYEHADAIGQNGAHFFCVQFDPATLIDASSSTATDRGAFRIEDQNAWSALSRLLAAFIAHQDNLQIESCLWEFRSALFEPPPKAAAPKMIARICERIRTASHTPPTLDELATECSVHRATLVRQFRMATGLSVGEFYRLARRHAALDLLMTSQESLSHIGLAVGYADQSHMTRDFAAHYGLPPQRFRKLSRVHFTGK
jgi:AraC-like DNA-binding protein